MTLEETRRWGEREPEVDARGMRGHIEGFPSQLAMAARSVGDVAASLVPDRPTAIAILGMGGSAIAGDLVAAYTSDRRRVPLVVIRDYDLPAWLDREAWVVASSYSGDTEETLSAYRQARERGVPAVAVTTGGRLGDMASEAGDPVYRLPPGLPPRAALGHSFGALAVLVARLARGLDDAAEAEAVTKASERLEPTARAWLAWEPTNPALQCAALTIQALPLLYAGHPVARAAARRWRTQLNENAKILAHTADFPEHNHNEIVGFEGETRAGSGVFYLETSWDHERVRRRFAYVRRFLDGKVAFQRRVEAGGETPLEGMLRLCLLGDCASFTASVITGRDPTPVASIDALKNELAR